ncbi:MAG: vitamin K epoxide reductase family protein, partial [Desulfuromonadales bacterium]
VSIGLAVSIFTVIEEMCLATACSDATSFAIFGFGMGWFGIAYFIILLMLLWLRNRISLFNLVFAATVFSGIGAELRLLWIQKYIIGSWCPLCVTICCALFITGILLFTEKIQGAKSVSCEGKNLRWWMALVVVMFAAGLTIAILGVKALT